MYVRDRGGKEEKGKLEAVWYESESHEKGAKITEGVSGGSIGVQQYIKKNAKCRKNDRNGKCYRTRRRQQHLRKPSGWSHHTHSTDLDAPQARCPISEKKRD